MTVTAAESGPWSFEQEGEEPELAEDLCKHGDTAHEAFFFHIAVNAYELFVAASSLRARRSRTKCW